MDKLQELGLTVVKSGVSLGGLADDARADVLALAWSVVPQQPMSEPEVNDVLRTVLAGPLCCLATDHVELRRWLVDGAWLQRDGFGRVYQRTATADLAPWQLAHAQPLLARPDIAAWVADLRGAKALARERRRAAWNSRGEGLGA
jgi:Uncharacterized protein conserved in bacteria (DUF2087)